MLPDDVVNLEARYDGSFLINGRQVTLTEFRRAFRELNDRARPTSEKDAEIERLRAVEEEARQFLDSDYLCQLHGELGPCKRCGPLRAALEAGTREGGGR